MKNLTNVRTGGLICFKHWGKQPSSAFNTVGREVKIGVLALCYFVALGEVRTEAQSVESSVDGHESLDELVVSAERSAQTESEVMRVVQVISKKDIQAAAAESVQDLLELSLNVDLRQRGQHGVQGDLSVRGGSFNQVMILLNGINITDPQTGHLSLDLPVDLDAIERIEVLSGPGAVVWGPNAFSGAVNIITGESKENYGKMRMAAGEHGFQHHSVTASATQGKATHFASMSYKSSEGYAENTDFKAKNIFYQTRWALDDASLNLQAGYNTKGFGSQNFYTAAYPNQFEATRTTFASLSMQTNGEVKLNPAMYFRRHQDRFELYRDSEGAASWYSGHNYHITDVFGANFHGAYSSQFGITRFGMDMRNEGVFSNVLGDDLDEPIDVPNEPEGQFTKSFSRTNVSYFLRQSVNYEWLTIGAGLMGSWNSNNGRDFYWNPGVDFSARIIPQLALRGSVNKSMRLPTFNELFYSGPTNVGNADLEPEEAVTFEGGFKFAGNGIKVEAGVFLRDAENLIDWVRFVEGEKYQTVNYTKMQTFGVEAKYEVDFPTLMEEDFPLSKVVLSYAYLESDKTETDFDSKYALDYLKHKFTATAHVNIFMNIDLALSYNWQDRNGRYDKFVDKVSVGSVDYNPIGLFDAKISWTEPKYRIYVSGSNLLDETYNDIGNVIQPGRWLIGGVVITLK